ncbi:alpha/beta hydrolase [Massilia sp. TS11]|uniref:alpha/beta hydrolase n=1 Tax=Massilia sp. TS11 TaxID=2908003 RepID=UPI001EDB4CC8|nr:alpha/beta hydrolase [Massilia sp. TS11]MCG2584296.1 alpha/beta hydrolase [Massilia sp. TS11]
MRPALLLALALSLPAGAAPLRLADYLALSGPAPQTTLRYGSAPSQFVEVFKPEGAGPFPVLLLVHGGCWTEKFGGIVQMRNLVPDLLRAGVAVWNVEYRRIDEAGGGYPGTYQDVGAAFDLLRQAGPGLGLDPQRVVAMGHSAGGQLVQWAAGRARIPAGSPLQVAAPLSVPTVISLGGLADLEHEAETIARSCGRSTADLAGTPSAARPNVFADTNAAALHPNGARTLLVTGELDTISPPRLATAYAERARAAGDVAEVHLLPQASHYDEVAARSPAWAITLPLILRALGR